MKLIVGLGNPGKAYANTHHNIGFRCISYFAKVHDISLRGRQCGAQVGIGEVLDIKVILAKPRSFMNQSGRAVKLLLQKFDIPPTNLIVIYDDLALPLGRIRIRPRGSAGGHKGAESIIDYVGSQDFSRIRVGIGRPDEISSAIDAPENKTIAYVLSVFSPAEEIIIKGTIAKVAEALFCLLTEGIAIAMDRYN